MRHLGAVLAAGVLVDHVVRDGARLVEGLRAAVAHDLGLRWAGTFDAVAQHGAADEADDGGRGAAAAVADGIARRAASDGTHHRARARLAARVGDLLIGADLLRHRHLLNDGRAADDAALLFLGVGRAGGGGRCCRQGKPDKRSEGVHGRLLIEEWGDCMLPPLRQAGVPALSLFVKAPTGGWPSSSRARASATFRPSTPADRMPPA